VSDAAEVASLVDNGTAAAAGADPLAAALTILSRAAKLHFLLFYRHHRAVAARCDTEARVHALRCDYAAAAKSVDAALSVLRVVFGASSLEVGRESLKLTQLRLLHCLQMPSVVAADAATAALAATISTMCIYDESVAYLRNNDADDEGTGKRSDGRRDDKMIVSGFGRFSDTSCVTDFSSTIPLSGDATELCAMRDALLECRQRV
jgi:hypothetical protein